MFEKSGNHSCFGTILLVLIIMGCSDDPSSDQKQAKIETDEIHKSINDRGDINATDIDGVRPLKNMPETSRKTNQGVAEFGLSDPAHPVYKQLSEASALLDRSVRIVTFGDEIGIQTPIPIDSLKKAIAIIDDAIDNCPNDVNILVAKASLMYILSDSEATEKLLNTVLSKYPNHFEASMAMRNPQDWRYAINYPAWSEYASQLHPAMSKRLSLQQRVQLVRDGFQKTVAIVSNIQGPPLDKHTQIKLKWILSDTPYGPLIVWYLRIIEPMGEPSTMEAFLPSFQPKFIPMEGYCLIQQLCEYPSCFIVFVQENHVIFNQKIVFNKNECEEIRNIVNKFSEAKRYISKKEFDKAMQWHMKNFRMDSLKFD